MPEFPKYPPKKPIPDPFLFLLLAIAGVAIIGMFIATAASL